MSAMWAVTAQVVYHDGDWSGSIGTPTFYLDENVQGITDADHAARIARRIVDPLDKADHVWVTAVKL